MSVCVWRVVDTCSVEIATALSVAREYGSTCMFSCDTVIYCILVYHLQFAVFIVCATIINPPVNKAFKSVSFQCKRYIQLSEDYIPPLLTGVSLMVDNDTAVRVLSGV